MSPTTRFWLRGLRPVLAIGVAMLVLDLFPVGGSPDTPGEFVAHGVVLVCVNIVIWFSFQWIRAWGRGAAENPDVPRTPWARRTVTAVAVWQAVGLALFAIALLLWTLGYLLQLALALR